MSDLISGDDGDVINSTTAEDGFLFSLPLNATFPLNSTANGSEVTQGYLSFLYQEIAMFTICSIGIFGNIFALMLMRRNELRRRSYANSLSLLAVVDTLVLAFNAFESIDRMIAAVSEDSNKVFDQLGTVSCKLYRYINPTLRVMSHWIIVAITAERFLAICFPFKVRISMKKSHMILLSACLIAILSQVWRLFFDGRHPYRLTINRDDGAALVASSNISSWSEVVTGDGGNMTGSTTLVANFSDFVIDDDGSTNDNGSNGNNGSDNSVTIEWASCGAPQSLITVYWKVNLIYHQLAMLFLLPAISIVSMNCAVVVKLYLAHAAMKRIGGGYHAGGGYKFSTPLVDFSMNHHRERASVCSRSDSRCSSTSTASPSFCCSSLSSSKSSTSTRSSRSSTNSEDRSILRTSLFLLSISFAFVICIVPELVSLLYLLEVHETRGFEQGMQLFIKIANVIKWAEIITTLGYADNFLIFALACGKFRHELKLMFLRCFGLCVPKCENEYWRCKSQQRARHYIAPQMSTSITPRRTLISIHNKQSSSTTVIPMMNDEASTTARALLQRNESFSHAPHLETIDEDTKAV